MGRFKQLLTAFVLAALAAAALSACGGSDKAALLPGETASEINANLDLVEQLVSEGDCVGAENAAAAVGEQVEGLSGVDEDLKAALSAGANRLNEVIVECDEAPEEDETVPSEELDEELETEQAKGEKAEQKAEEKATKEAEKEAQKEEKAEKETPPVEPPEPPGQEEKEVPPSEGGDGGTSSGGVAPSTPAGAE